ncbi:MAG: polysaccharide deacetylase family protein [Candidatus Latescibacteria bacterium]|nr:polysaccharide deacetylase family protein [Candidatus Latescibacterota bacterium]
MSTARRLPILVYHHVYRQDEPLLQQADFATGAGIIGLQAFAQQLDFLLEQGWTFVSTTQVVDWLTNGASLPTKTCALHFDNGWLDTATVVLPHLRSLGLTATCFPITDGLEAASQGRSAAVRTLTEGVVEHPFMTWDQAGELAAAGWELGAHTATHCKMADTYAENGAAGVIAEAERANALFAHHLGAVPEHFAYPSGSRTAATDALLAGYYRSLRLWEFAWPVSWTFTHADTSPLGLACQNIDLRVPFADFTRLFDQALAA